LEKLVFEERGEKPSTKLQPLSYIQGEAATTEFPVIATFSPDFRFFSLSYSKAQILMCFSLLYLQEFGTFPDTYL